MKTLKRFERFTAGYPAELRFVMQNKTDNRRHEDRRIDSRLVEVIEELLSMEGFVADRRPLIEEAEILWNSPPNIENAAV